MINLQVNKNWIDTAALAATLKERSVTYDMMDSSKGTVYCRRSSSNGLLKMDIAAFKEPAISIQDSYADANGLKSYLEMIRRAQ